MAKNGRQRQKNETPAEGGPRWRSRLSSIHGRGAFCLRPIALGELVGVYAGRAITEDEAVELYGPDAEHTFLFSRADGLVVDGGQGGNGTRFINHGCDPNVEASEEGLSIALRACRDIEPGEELLLDYRLQTESEDPLASHPCRCGSPLCRGTMAWDDAWDGSGPLGAQGRAAPTD